MTELSERWEQKMSVKYQSPPGEVLGSVSGLRNGVNPGCAFESPRGAWLPFMGDEHLQPSESRSGVTGVRKEQEGTPRTPVLL